jgi:hypothetical protein
MQMLKLFRANHLALIPTLCTLRSIMSGLFVPFSSEFAPVNLLNCLVDKNKPSVLNKPIQKKNTLKIKLHF